MEERSGMMKQSDEEWSGRVEWRCGAEWRIEAKWSGRVEVWSEME